MPYFSIENVNWVTVYNSESEEKRAVFDTQHGTCMHASAMPMRSGVIQASAVPAVGKARIAVESRTASVTTCEMMFALL